MHCAARSTFFEPAVRKMYLEFQGLNEMNSLFKLIASSMNDQGLDKPKSQSSRPPNPALNSILTDKTLFRDRKDGSCVREYSEMF